MMKCIVLSGGVKRVWLNVEDPCYAPPLRSRTSLMRSKLEACGRVGGSGDASGRDFRHSYRAYILARD